MNASGSGCVVKSGLSSKFLLKCDFENSSIGQQKGIMLPKWAHLNTSL